MKVLFICRANVIRSQMAAAFYNQLTGTADADSAGTVIDEPGETLGERAQDHPAAKLVIETMRAKGIDMSPRVRTQLTPGMAEKYDLVINMAQAQYTPDWLAKLSNYRYWEIVDPMAKGLALTAQTRDTVEQKIKTLLAES